jgi:glycosyltransferase 2 family protein
LANLPPEPVTIRSRPWRTLILTASAILLVLVLIAYRTRGLSFRWGLFWTTLGTLDWRWLIASICLILLTNVVRAVRWRVMLAPFGRPLGVWRLTSDTAIGLSAGALLGRAGEVIRPYLIAVQAGLPFSSQLAAWLLERVLDLLAVLLLCAYAFIRLPAYHRHLGPKIQDAVTAGGYLLAAAGVVCVVVLLAFGDPSGRAQQRISSALTFLPQHQQDRVGRVLDAFSQGLQCTRDPKSLALLVGYTLLQWAIVVGGSAALLLGFAATRSLGLWDILVLLAFMTLGSAVQVPGIGGGAQAALILALTGIYGLSIEAASGVAVWLWIVSTLAIVPFGLACAFHEGLNWSKLKLLSAKQILDESEV